MITQKKITVFNSLRNLIHLLHYVGKCRIDPLMYCNKLVPETWQSIQYMDSKEGAICYCALGLGGEAGEVMDLIKKSINNFHSMWKGKDFKENLIRELKLEIGDLLWYTMALINIYGLDLKEILTINARKVLNANLILLKKGSYRQKTQSWWRDGREV